MAAKLTPLTLGVLTVLALTAGTAGALSKCQGSKIKAVGKKAGCLLGLESKEASTGSVPLPDKVAKCKTKLSQTFAKADAGNDCATAGDATPLESKVDAFVVDVDGELAVGTLPSKCQSAKIKAAGKKARCLLGLEAKAASSGVGPDAGKVAKCRSKFSSSFAKAQRKTDCRTGADRNPIEAKVDAFIDDVLCELGPACGCGSSVEGGLLGFTTDVPGGAPTGQVTPPRCVGGASAGGSCTVDSDCGAACVGGPNPGMACPPAACSPGVCVPGVCRGHLDRGGQYVGGGVVGVTLPSVVPDNGTSFTRVSCCSGSSLIIKKTTAGEAAITDLTCSAAGCKYGPPLPVTNPITSAASTCIITTVAQDALGSGQCLTGEVSIRIPVSSAISLTGDNQLPRRCSYGSPDDNQGRFCNTDPDCPGGGTCIDDSAAIQPCPICNPTTLKCNGGTNDVVGNPPVACVPGTLNTTGDAFPTSHDCPPGGIPVGSLPVSYFLTTGTASATAVDLPAQSRVFCGFCFDNATTFAYANPPVPCESDSDCTSQAPFITCKQSNGGAFANAAATDISETGTPAGNLTDLASHPAVLVSVSCIAPTYSSIVDPAAGLPGPGAVSLPGSARLISAP